MSHAIVVIGSLSLDMVFEVPRRPNKGETVKGMSFSTFVGGKGNNQALAAAKAGATVSMVGRVGDDQYAEPIYETLNQNGVDVRFLTRDPRVGTGLANIYIDPEGDNSIIIVPRANDELSPDDVDRAADLIAACKVVVLQLEVPMKTVLYAAKKCKAAGKTVLLNPAPAPPDGQLSDELLACIDTLIPNQSEASLLSSMEVGSQTSAIEAARHLQKHGVKNVIITLAEKGALAVCQNQDPIFAPAYRVTARDTTAAGDAFVGTFAARLARGDDLSTCLRYACAAGALATTKPGAASSLPDANEIENLVHSARVQ